jgi:hypothetical protein
MGEPPAHLADLEARIGAGGNVTDSVVLRTTSYSTLAMHAAYHDGAYDVLWEDDEGDISSVTLPAVGPLPTPVPQKFLSVGGTTQYVDVAFTAKGWSGWIAVNSRNSFHTSGGLDFYMQGGIVLPVVAVDGLALTGGWFSSFTGAGLKLGLAEPESDVAYLQSLPGVIVGDLSEAVGDHALLATVDSSWILGEPTQRIRTRVLTVSGGVPAGSGGAGGADNASSGGGIESAAGGANGGDAGSSVTAGGVGVANEAGSPNQAEAGASAAGSPSEPSAGGSPDHASGGAAQQPPLGSAGDTNASEGGSQSVTEGGSPNDGTPGSQAGTSTSPDRYSRGCGCRAATGSTGAGELNYYSLVFLLLITARRIRHAHPHPANRSAA